MTLLESAVVAADPEELCRFYREVFGLADAWTVHLDGDAIARSGLGAPCTVRCLADAVGNRLKILGPAPRDRCASNGPVVATPGRPLFSLVVDDLDATRAAAEAAGGRPLGDGAVIEPKPGVRITFLTDLEGNALELIERNLTPAAD